MSISHAKVLIRETFQIYSLCA